MSDKYDELRRLSKGATARPWWAGSDDDAHMVYVGTDEVAEVANALRDDGDGELEATNAEFITAAANAIDGLLAERDALRSACARIVAAEQARDAPALVDAIADARAALAEGA